MSDTNPLYGPKKAYKLPDEELGPELPEATPPEDQEDIATVVAGASNQPPAQHIRVRLGPPPPKNPIRRLIFELREDIGSGIFFFFFTTSVIGIILAGASTFVPTESDAALLFRGAATIFIVLSILTTGLLTLIAYPFNGGMSKRLGITTIITGIIALGAVYFFVWLPVNELRTEDQRQEKLALIQAQKKRLALVQTAADKNSQALLENCGKAISLAYQTQASTFIQYLEKDGLQTTEEKLNEAYASRLDACGK